MKVAVHADGPTVRGNERQVLRVAAGLRARGHDVVVSCRAGSPVEAAFRAAGLRTTSIRPRGDADLYHALRFVRWLRRERPDAVLLTSWKRAFVAAGCARLAGVRRVVLRIGALQEIRPVRVRLERFALEHWYDAVVANSQGVRAQVLRTAPRAREVRVVHNAVDPGSGPPAQLRAELGLSTATRVAVAVGGWEASKGFRDLIEAVPDAPARLHVVLVGGGDRSRGAALRARARELGVEGRVHLLGHRYDVAQLLTAADLVLLPSRSEGLSVALLEAMAAGRPVLATDIAGVPDALGARRGRGPAGWIVPSRDPPALARGVSDLLARVEEGDPEVVARAAEARWRVEHWFSEARMLDGYEAALSGPAPPAAP